MNQTQTFIDSEGNAWFERNQRRLGERDPVSERMRARGIMPKRILEIGCANGWRLKRLKEEYGCDVAGIDPSKQAVQLADMKEVQRGWASRLCFLDGDFDTVIYGFCLYVTDPDEWFAIVAEGDRVLANGGRIVIHDFGDYASPHAVKYAHADGVLAYHVNFAALWLMHPWYRLIDWHPTGDSELVAIIEKDSKRLPVWP